MGAQAQPGKGTPAKQAAAPGKQKAQPQVCYGVVAMTADCRKVAMVRGPGQGAWRFPHAPFDHAFSERQQLEAALSVASAQLGLDLRPRLCCQPVIHATGPGPKTDTKFFLALGVEELPLEPSAPAPTPAAAPGGGTGEAAAAVGEAGSSAAAMAATDAAAEPAAGGDAAAGGAPAGGAAAGGDDVTAVEQAGWQDVGEMLKETAGLPITGNPMVAVLRQLQGLVARGVPQLPPRSAATGAGDGASPAGELAGLLSWQADKAWQGPTPMQYLEGYCRDHKLPSPAFNVFREPSRGEGGAAGARRHPQQGQGQKQRFCVTCMLPHLGLQVSPDAAYPSAEEALQNGALAGVLYLEGALHPGCPLVHLQPAGEMAKVPNCYLTEAEVGGEQQRKAAEAEVARKRRELERQMADLKRQAAALDTAAAGGALPASVGSGAGAGAGAEQRPAKRLKAVPTLPEALSQIPRDKNPVQALKELCDKCRFPAPTYAEHRQPSGMYVCDVSLPQAGIVDVEGAPAVEQRLAKSGAAERALELLRRGGGL